MKEQQAKMEGLKAELSGLESEVNAHEEATLDYKHAIDKYEGVIKENSSKIRHWKKDVRALICCLKGNRNSYYFLLCH